MRLLHVLLVGLMLFGSSSTAGEFRTWTDKRGKTLKGELLHYDGEVVSIRRSDGKKFAIPLDRFSPDDVEYLNIRSAQSLNDFLGEAPNELSFEQIKDEVRYVRAKIKLTGPTYWLFEDVDNPKPNKVLKIYCGKIGGGGQKETSERYPENVVVTLRGQTTWASDGLTLRNHGRDSRNPDIVDGEDRFLAGMAALEKKRDEKLTKVAALVRSGPARSMREYVASNTWDLSPGPANIVLAKGTVESVSLDRATHGNLICVRMAAFLSASGGSCIVDCLFPKQEQTRLAKLAKGDPIEVRGLVVARGLTFRMNHCHIVHSEKIALK